MNINHVRLVRNSDATIARTLAASVVAQIQSDPTLEPHIRNALLGTVGDLAQHGNDCAVAEAEAASVFVRMRCAPSKHDDGDITDTPQG